MNNKKIINYPFFHTLKILIQGALDHDKGLVGLTLAFTLVSAILPLFALAFPRFILAELLQGEAASINYIIWVTVMLSLGTIVFGFAEAYLRSISYVRILAVRIDYLNREFHHFNTMDYRYTEDDEFLSSLDNAMRGVSSDHIGMQGMMHRMFEMGAKVTIILFYSILVFQLGWFIVLGIFVSVVVGWLISIATERFRYSLKKEIGHAERRLDYYNKTTFDFSYGKDIRLYHLQDQLQTNYRHEIISAVSLLLRIKNREYFLGLTELFFLLISDGLIYATLILSVQQGTMSIADFSMYLVAVMTLSTTLKTFANDVSFLIGEGLYVHDFFTFEQQNLIENNGTRLSVPEDTLTIEFQHVSFRYPRSERWIVRDCNLTITAGQKLALVGINGAGKTTIVKLLTRLYEPTEGQILINGIPASSFDKKAYQAMIAVVFQDVNILAMTVEENITLGHVRGDKEALWHCLNQVGLGKKIKQFPKQLRQPLLKIIEEDGTELSGGENQKLAIARALYKQGKMVILDEPTAALDALAESEIYQEMNELVGHKTAIYISHRLSSTKFCDRIALFADGKVIEYGTHDELMALQGDYYHMFVTQGKYYQSEQGGNYYEIVGEH